MEKTVRYFAFAALGITLMLLLVGQAPAAGQSGSSVSSGANPDMVVVVSEDYLNRVIKADLEEKNPLAVKDVSVQLMENEPIEVNAVISLGFGPLAKDQNVAVEANISIVNDTLKVEPKVLKVGFLNLPEQTWVGPIKSAMQEVEASANDAYQDALMKGYKVTSVTTGNNTLTLSVMAPDKPFEMK
ncbi:MAG: hypothetical protein NTW84_06625 [Methanothrix sp.]|jgi:hypothetical protein|nr:hypothetical protein [Methanothrix sp.]